MKTWGLRGSPPRQIEHWLLTHWNTEYVPMIRLVHDIQWITKQDERDENSQSAQTLSEKNFTSGETSSHIKQCPSKHLEPEFQRTVLWIDTDMRKQHDI